MPSPSKPKTTVGPLATPEGRLSFPHLATPETEGQFPSNKYVGTLLIPKTANIDVLKAACVKAAQLTWPEQNIQTLGQIKLPFRDGDEKALDGYAGNIYIVCKTKNKPVVVGPNKEDYIGTIKGGDFVRFSVTAGAYKQQLTLEVAQALQSAGKLVVTGRNANGQQENWRPAVTFYLNAVQYLREGPAFGGGGGVNAFDDVSAGAASQAERDLFGG